MKKRVCFIDDNLDLGIISGRFNIPVEVAFFEAAVGEGIVRVWAGNCGGTTGHRKKKEKGP